MARRRQRGSGEVLPPHTKGNKGDGWAIRWREDGRRRFKGGLASKAIADRVLAKIHGDLAHDRTGLPPDVRGLPSLKALADDWLERRKETHRAADDDAGRWRNHLEPIVGRLRAPDVDHALVRSIVERKLREGLNPATVGHLVKLLSTMFADLIERPRETGVTANPIRSLPRSTRRLYKPSHDPKATPFIEQLDDVRRVYQAIDGERYRVAYALGALAGLRTGEVLGLHWRDVDLERGRLTVRQQVYDSALGPLKDDEARIVPVQTALIPILKAWKLKSGGTGLVIAPRFGGGGRRGAGGGQFVKPITLHKKLRPALKACGLDVALTWYQATRHTFASQWVLAGGSIEKLSAVMGHSTTWVTERYAHLRPDLFRPQDHEILAVDLERGDGKVVALENGQPSASREDPKVKRKSRKG